MKKIFSKLITFIAGGIFATLTYANDSPYFVDLISEPTPLVAPNTGTVVYSITNRMAFTLTNNGFSPNWLKSLPSSVVYTTAFTLPAGGVKCTMPYFTLQPNGETGDTCYAAFLVSANVASLDGAEVISNGPVICGSPQNEGNCYKTIKEAYFSVEIESADCAIPLSISPSTLDTLVAGTEASWTITNLCGIGTNCASLPESCDTTAYNIQATLDGLSITGFDNDACTIATGIGPGRTCTAYGIAGPNLNSTPINITFQGSNTLAVSDSVIVVASGTGTLQPVSGITSVTITQNSTQTTTPYCLAYQNSSATASLAITGVTVNGLGTTLSNVTQVAPLSGLNCDSDPTLTPGETCYVCFTGDPSAYGSGTVDVNSTGGSVNGETISVAATTLALNGGAPIELPASATTTDVTLANIGNFDLVDGTSALVNTVTNLDNVVPPAGCADLTWSGGATPDCTIPFTTTDVPVSNAASYQASGTNAALVSEPITVAGGPPSVTVTSSGATDANGQHMQYSLLTITNPVGSPTVTLTGVTYTGVVPGTNVHTCTGPTDALCDYPATTGCYTGSTLAAGSSCTLPIKALTTGTQALGPVTGTITVTLNNGSSFPFIFKIAQEMAVYATGYFEGTAVSSGSNIPLNYIAKYDGTNWSTLDTWTSLSYVGGNDKGLGNVGNALAVYRGDLYAGGSFASASGKSASNIALWNGANWFPLQSGTDGVVNALSPVADANLVSGTNPLYMGGAFFNANGTYARSVAQWVGASSALQPLGNISGAGVSWYNFGIFGYLQGIANALLTSGDNLYTAGQIAATYNNNSNLPYITVGATLTIAEWLPTSSNIWASLNDGVGVLVIGGNGFAMVKKGSDLYLGGSFTESTNLTSGCPGFTFSANVARYDGTCWHNVDSGFSDNVRALTVDNAGNVYAGGNFTCSADLSRYLNHVAKYTGSGNWTQVGGGLGVTDPPIPFFNIPVCFSTSDVVKTLEAYNGSIYAGGSYSTPNSNVSYFNGTNWVALGTGTTTGLNNTVNDVLVAASIQIVP